MERDWRVIDGRLLFRIRRLATTRKITISELLSQSLDALEQVDELRLEVTSLAQTIGRTEDAMQKLHATLCSLEVE